MMKFAIIRKATMHRQNFTFDFALKFLDDEIATMLLNNFGEQT